jgi:hypothetical protein
MSTTNQLTPASPTVTITDQIDNTAKATMYLLMEDNVSKLLMEDDSGYILMERSYWPPTTTNQLP